MKVLPKLLLLCSLFFTPFLVTAGPVDINSADAKAIAAAMQGVGAKKAEAIVAERDKNGAFKSIDDLTRVKGINAKTIEANRTKITAGGGAANAKAAKLQ